MKPVFVVDDDASYRELLLLTLEDHCGIERVDGFGDGQGLLRALTAAAGAADAPGLVLLDFHMPDMSGLEVMREIRRIAPELPVAFLSGAAGPQEREACLAAGAHAFLHKPVAYQELVRALQDLVRSVAGGDASGS